MIVKLLTEHHLGFLSLKGGCTGLSESTLVKMSNCWKSHAAAQLLIDKKILIQSGQRLCSLHEETTSPQGLKESAIHGNR